ncbi:MAG: hypothetical protein KDJ52_11080 [Anaerolineae bacterium]|nr:hypothetical protein [Anaerolineae bacterium]
MAFLDRLFRLYPTERGLVLTLGFLLLSNSLALNLSDVVAISGFLSDVGPNGFLVVWSINMLLIVLTTGVQSLVVDRFNRIRVMQMMCLFLMLAYITLPFMFAGNLLPDWFNYSTLYLLAEQQGLFFPIVFWVLANDMFNAAQARRLFPIISSWAFAGQILGLSLAGSFPFLPNYINVTSRELLFFNAVLFLLAYILLTRRLYKVKIRETQYKRETIRETLTEGWGFVREVPSFRYLMFSMLAIYLALTILDYHFLVESDRTPLLNEAGNFQTFYASFHLVLTLAAVAIQGLLTSRIITKMALKNTFFILPSMLLASAVAVLAIPGLISAALGLGVPYLTKDSIDESAQKSLQALVPEERRGRVSLFMDSYLYAFGTILGCLVTGVALIIGYQWPYINNSYFYLPLAVLSAICAIVAVFKMRAAYETSLLNWRLKRRSRRASATSVFELLDL